MEALELLKEAEQMIKELQDAWVNHSRATSLRRKIRKYLSLTVCEYCGHNDGSHDMAMHSNPARRAVTK